MWVEGIGTTVFSGGSAVATAAYRHCLAEDSRTPLPTRLAFPRLRSRSAGAIGFGVGAPSWRGNHQRGAKPFTPTPEKTILVLFSLMRSHASGTANGG